MAKKACRCGETVCTGGQWALWWIASTVPCALLCIPMNPHIFLTESSVSSVTPTTSEALAWTDTDAPLQENSITGFTTGHKTRMGTKQTMSVY